MTSHAGSGREFAAPSARPAPPAPVGLFGTRSPTRRASCCCSLLSGVEVTATSAIAHEMGEGAWNRGSLPIIGALRAATG
jgi:hypothetical protein